MKERPILFNGPMVRAILDGRKTQTRRVLKHPDEQVRAQLLRTDPGGLGIQAMHGTSPDGVKFGDWRQWRAVGIDYPDDQRDDVFCPYGQVGDRLWVRETFQPHWKDGILDVDDVDYKTGKGYEIRYMATQKKIETYDMYEEKVECAAKPSIHMPRWACRLILEVTAVRVERLKDIGGNDAIAEGIERVDGEAPWRTFKHLWDSINEKRGYGFMSNPWVWVVEFRYLPKENSQ